MNQQEKVDWQEVYKLPFYNDDHCAIYVRDAENRTVFNKADNDADELIEKINGFSDKKFNVTREGIWICVDGVRKLMIRGWGRLTGLNAYCLHGTDAAALQDEFGDWIVNKLKE